MAGMVWSDKMSVGNYEIDAQHKKLLNLVNNVSIAVMTGKPMTVQVILDQLVRYTEEHFKDEEALMEKMGYPKLEEHRAIHEALVAQAVDIQWQLKRCKPVSMITVIRFLSDWLMNHILKEDMDYKPYMKG